MQTWRFDEYPLPRNIYIEQKVKEMDEGLPAFWRLSALSGGVSMPILWEITSIKGLGEEEVFMAPHHIDAPFDDFTWEAPMEFGLEFPGGLIRRSIIDGVEHKTYMLKDHDGNWQEVAWETWDEARQQAEREKKG